jgi:hypothetical protein
MWETWHENETQAPIAAVEETMKPSCKIQFVRSVTEWSQNVPTETSVYNACKSLPKNTHKIELLTRI